MANLPNLSHSGNKTNKQKTAIRLVSQIPLSLRKETMSCAKSYCCSKFKKIMVIVICESVVLDYEFGFHKGLISWMWNLSCNRIYPERLKGR